MIDSFPRADTVADIRARLEALDDYVRGKSYLLIAATKTTTNSSRASDYASSIRNGCLQVSVRWPAPRKRKATGDALEHQGRPEAKHHKGQPAQDAPSDAHAGSSAAGGQASPAAPAPGGSVSAQQAAILPLRFRLPSTFWDPQADITRLQWLLHKVTVIVPANPQIRINLSETHEVWGQIELAIIRFAASRDLSILEPALRDALQRGAVGTQHARVPPFILRNIGGMEGFSTMPGAALVQLQWSQDMAAWEPPAPPTAVTGWDMYMDCCAPGARHEAPPAGLAHPPHDSLPFSLQENVTLTGRGPLHTSYNHGLQERVRETLPPPKKRWPCKFICLPLQTFAKAKEANAHMRTCPLNPASMLLDTDTSSDPSPDAQDRSAGADTHAPGKDPNTKPQADGTRDQGSGSKHDTKQTYQGATLSGIVADALLGRMEDVTDLANKAWRSIKASHIVAVLLVIALCSIDGQGGLEPTRASPMQGHDVWRAAADAAPEWRWQAQGAEARRARITTAMVDGTHISPADREYITRVGWFEQGYWWTGGAHPPPHGIARTPRVRILPTTHPPDHTPPTDSDYNDDDGLQADSGSDNDSDGGDNLEASNPGLVEWCDRLGSIGWCDNLGSGQLDGATALVQLN